MMPRETMEVVKSIRISLTMDDIIDHVGLLTKQQIVQKFRLLLDKKQIQINQKIEKNNAEHLLVLQKKMLILEKKDDQIVKLTNSISTYKNQLHEEKIKNNDITDELIEAKLKANHFQKKFNQFDNIFKQEKAKREKLKKQHQKLTAQYKQLVDQHHLQVMGHKKVKDERTSWREQTQFLLNNLKKNHEQQLQNKLKILKLANDHKIVELEQAYLDQKKKYETYKQKYMDSKKTISTLNRVMQILNKELQSEKLKQRKNTKQVTQAQTQTEQIQGQNKNNCGEDLQKSQINKSIARSLKNEEEKKKQQQAQVQIKIQCQQCANYKNTIQSLENQLKMFKPKEFKKVQKIRTLAYGVQATPPPPPVKEESQCQTLFKPLSAEEQMELVGNVRRIKYTSQILIQHWKEKYEFIQKLFQNRPSKIEDRKRISDLQTQKLKNQHQILQNKRKIQSLQFLIKELHQKNNQQIAILNQFDMQQVQIKSMNKTLELKAENAEQSFFNRAHFSNIRIIKSHKDKRSQTCTSRQFKNKNRSFSLNAADRTKNLSLSMNANVLDQTQENQGDNCLIQSPKIKQQAKSSEKNLNKLNTLLLQRGIVFKQKVKKQGEQMSEIRKYKKYKGSLKKVVC